jgi:tRNA threonylcarbamoyladenosine biosynthesis protein TsaB
VTPRILALDTTHEHGSLALDPGGEIELHAPDGFAHVIYARLAELLDAHGLRPADIDCFAAASGPGSFTGVRVGLACIKGLAEATGKPAIAISNLAAISTFGTAPLRAVAIDARRGEIYGAVYDSEARLVQPEVVTKLEDWLASVPAGAEFLSPDIEREGWRQTPRALAGAIARLARARHLRGESSDPAALDANYVRRSDAELLFKPAI